MITVKNILCPVDFFPASIRAFEYALKLAANYDAKIHLLHVVAPVAHTPYDLPISISELTAALEEESKRQLQKLRAKAERVQVALTTEVLFGDVERAIHKSIRRTKADIVVMGTHGRPPFTRWFLGSTTERLMRRCPVPLVTIASTERVTPASASIRRMLVTTDFSIGTSNALDYAFSLAQERHAQITFLHVVSHLKMNSVPFELREPFVEAFHRRMDGLVPAEARARCDVAIRVETGLPYKVIPRVLEAGSIDLVIMNIHGKGMLERVMVGSTAERVIRIAKCPVMLIPPAFRKHGRRQVSGKKKAKGIRSGVKKQVSTPA